jgi:hypothetical protein
VGNVVTVRQDFKGDMTDAELQNTVHLLVHNIASFRDHAIKFAGKDQAQKNVIDQTVSQSLDLKIMIDLWNKEKHGGDSRDSKSNLHPRLINVARSLRLQTSDKLNSFMSFVLGADGNLVLTGDGESKLIVNGEVVDQNGDFIGSLGEIAERAVNTLERLLDEIQNS